MIYLASPYSSPDASIRLARYDAACRAAAWLMKLGHLVFSPIAHSHGIARYCNNDQPWEFWRRQDEWFLERAHALVVLCIDGWETSIGVNAEIQAFSPREPIEYYKPGVNDSVVATLLSALLKGDISG